MRPVQEARLLWEEASVGVELEVVEFWGVVVEGGLWGRRVGEGGAVSEVGGRESPTPFDEASPLDFKA